MPRITSDPAMVRIVSREERLERDKRLRKNCAPVEVVSKKRLEALAITVKETPRRKPGKKPLPEEQVKELTALYRKVLEAVCLYTGCDFQEALKGERAREYSRARSIATYIGQERLSIIIPYRIGATLTNVNHKSLYVGKMKFQRITLATSSLWQSRLKRILGHLQESGVELKNQP